MKHSSVMPFFRRGDIKHYIFAALAIAILYAWRHWDDFFAPNIVARVLFSETASCTDHERRLVAGVMKNRIHHPAFGNTASLDAVVRQRHAFSCVNDPDNTNWRKTLHPDQLTASEKFIWNQCLAIAHGNIPPALGPSGRPLVFYYDKSIAKPPGWTNDQWRAIEEMSTQHFVFYSVVPAGK